MCAPNWQLSFASTAQRCDLRTAYEDEKSKVPPGKQCLSPTGKGSLMITINLNTLILRPVGEVFDFIAAPENNAHWQYGSLESVKISDGDVKVGTLFSSFGHFMGRRIYSTFEVTEYEPDKTYGFRTLSGPVKLLTSYKFKAITGGTDILTSTQIHAGRFFKLADPLVAKVAMIQFRDNLAMLKELLESRDVLRVG
jgi:uncharacterized protein YndB with AHSA1/START domain